eukprot:5774359-Amphidinium_carterae.1
MNPSTATLSTLSLEKVLHQEECSSHCVTWLQCAPSSGEMRCAIIHTADQHGVQNSVYTPGGMT